MEDKKIIELLQGIEARQKKDKIELLKAIKKNRTTMIKKAFDKSMISPVIQSNAEMREKVEKKLNDVHISLTRTIDVFSEKITDKIRNGLESFINIFKK